MRPLWKDILLAAWLGMLLPGILLNAAVFRERQLEAEAVAEEVTVSETGLSILVKAPDTDPVFMDMDDYLTGVLLAEMPAQFHEEALKAQAVAARTYTWKARQTGGKHGDGSVCTEPSCCQGFLTEESYLSRGGLPENLEKLRYCVNETSPMVILYRGELIEATYFSSSGGTTESALAVWGTDYPYLRSVSSPEEASVSESRMFSADSFQKLLGRDLPEDPTSWFGEVEYTQGGGIANLEIAGESYSGVALRALLGLRSTDFSIEAADNTIIITTKGHGHRVGMSQHGANTMANSGSNYQKILQHYYPGTTLAPIWEENT